MNHQQDELAKGLNMIADAIEHGALLPPGMVDTVRRGASEIGELYHALKFERQENGTAFLARLTTQGGAIVSSSECSEMEIADARARGDFYVDADGLGYVLRLKRWLDLQRSREGIEDRCAAIAEKFAQDAADNPDASNLDIQYGRIDAGESIAKAIRELRTEAPPEKARMLAALQSIAKNTCCDRCQEAALVAQTVIQPYGGD